MPTPALQKLLKLVKLGAALVILFGGPLLLVAVVLFALTQTHHPHRAVSWHLALLAAVSVMVYISVATALIFVIRRLRTGHWTTSAENQRRSRERRNSPVFKRWVKIGRTFGFTVNLAGIGILVWVSARNPHTDFTLLWTIQVVALALSASIFWIAGHRNPSTRSHQFHP